MDIVHSSVMPREVEEYLAPALTLGPLVDCTLGEGGHTHMFLSRYPDARVIGLDADSRIQAVAKERLKDFEGRVEFVNTWFNEFFKNPPAELEPGAVLFDLGISVFHYAKSGRGFTFTSEEPLDMRLNADLEVSAAHIVNNYSEGDIADIIYINGEERYSRRIAKAICDARKQTPITTAKELAEIIFTSVPVKYRHGRIHPATRTFQALRIVVNGELVRIEEAIRNAFSILKPGGRIGVISFHSLEDRIVKNTFKSLKAECVCPPDTPMCKCKGAAEILTKKPLVPLDDEVKENSPSRSAKFRVIEKRDPSVVYEDKYKKKGRR